MSNWVKHLDDDLSLVSHERAHQIIKMCTTNMVVTFKNQNLTPQDEISFVSKIGNYQQTHKDRGKHLGIPEVDGILRVTRGALFGHDKELDWHANQPSYIDRKPLIWLYGIEGTEGSVTSWINMIEAYNDLPMDTKEEIKDIEMYCGYKRGSYSDFEYFDDHVNRNLPRKLVYTNEEGVTGLFFPFLQIFEFINYPDAYFKSIKEDLVDHVLNKKYMYDHYWKDGDVVISEQWLSIHKRWECNFMDKRILHRIAFDHSKVYNDSY